MCYCLDTKSGNSCASVVICMGVGRGEERAPPTFSQYTVCYVHSIAKVCGLISLDQVKMAERPVKPGFYRVELFKTV